MATATTASPDSTTPSEADPAAPLLEPRGNRSSARGGPILSSAARFLRQASSRRMMGEPSVAVRESAAEHLEDRRSDWAYSRPVVVLDVLWNFAFVATSCVVLAFSRNERPCLPLRIWIAGYALQCVLHIACVCVEYRQRHPHRDADGGGSSSGRLRSGFSSPMNVGESSGQEGQDENQTRSAAKHLESANTMFSFIWWIIGFYWVSAGGQDLTRDCPQLYWLCIMFLAFDVIFVVFCVALACVVGIAVCCCLPCIIAILYAVADQEGASEEDIRQLPKYKFQGIINSEKLGGEISESSGGIMTECESVPPIEHVLSAEDAECCICLSPYDDGVELRELPCSHHFHCACIDKWLYINATCPLCKFNIIKSNNNGAEEV